ncbi:hypothetical protein ACZ90_43450 [Streptomyces albus subsp. albus]|nr:hypothetical protein ACZ90_43450 [Streptomyces albus subsp. albus]
MNDPRSVGVAVSVPALPASLTRKPSGVRPLPPWMVTDAVAPPSSSPCTSTWSGVALGLMRSVPTTRTRSCTRGSRAETSVNRPATRSRVARKWPAMIVRIEFPAARSRLQASSAGMLPPPKGSPAATTTADSSVPIRPLASRSATNLALGE